MSKLHRDNAGYVGCSYEETQDPYYSYNKLSLPLSESDKTVIRDEETFTITVANSKFVVDGVSQASLSLAEGGVYTFDQSDSSNTGHPLRFSYTADGTHGGGQEYTLGVTTNGTPGSAGAYTKIVVPFGLHDLYYYCSVHSGYGGFANVAKDPFKFTTGLPILKTTDAFGKTLGTGNNEDPYAANLVLAVPMAGGNFNDIHADIKGSGTNKNVDISGVTSNTNSRLYGSAGEFVGATDHLQFYGTARDNTPDFAFAANEDFTVEAWIWWDSDNQTGNTGSIVADYYEGSTDTSPNWQFVRRAGGALGIWWSNNGTIVSIDTGPGFISNKSWHHVAVQREASTFKFFVDGYLRSSYSDPSYSNAIGRGRSLWVGIDANEVAEDFCGYIQDLRIYKGVAKYTTPFPTGSYGMDVVTYTGNSSTQNITGLNFQPDFVWAKKRNGTTYHNLVDSVRGANKELYSNDTLAETTPATAGLTAFNSDGFALGANSGWNNNNDTYVAWCWKAGGAAVSNTDGTITSQVSANNDYGFSIVSYTSDSSATQTVGHGLGSAPKLIFFKDRDAATNWFVHHNDGSTGRMFEGLNTTAAGTTNLVAMNNTLPSASVFSLNSGGYTINPNGNHAMIAYCWSEISGFSKFGSFSGTGVSGNTVTTGFKPRFLIIKRTDSTGNWWIWDTERGNNKFLYADASTGGNANDAVVGSYPINATATGFSIDNTADLNATGANYIYAAFAESAPGDAAFESAIVDQLDLKDRSGNDNNASNAGATWQTSVSKFYDGAMATNTKHKVVQVTSDDFNVGTGDFTLEFWVYSTSSAQEGGVWPRFISTGENATTSIQVGHIGTSTGRIRYTHSDNNQYAFSPDTDFRNQWVHVAVVRSGGVVSVYCNGSRGQTFSDANAKTSTSMYISGYQSNNGAMTGYIQDVKWYKHLAKYTSSFSPPERSVQGTARRYPSGVYVVS